jgi:hypothetical protein
MAAGSVLGRVCRLVLDEPQAQQFARILFGWASRRTASASFCSM